MTIKHLILRYTLFLILCFFLGCSKTASQHVLAPVQGKVTYNGKPVVGASVAFLCTGAPRHAVGQTDESGIYRLTTFDTNDGAIIGSHTVTVKTFGSLPSPTDQAASKPMSEEEMAKAIAASMKQTAQRMMKARQSAPLIPKKYGDRNTTDLNKEVTAGENVIDIELVD